MDYENYKYFLTKTLQLNTDSAEYDGALSQYGDDDMDSSFYVDYLEYKKENCQQ